MTFTAGAVSVEGAVGRAIPADDVDEAVRPPSRSGRVRLLDELVRYRTEVEGGRPNPADDLTATTRCRVDDRHGRRGF